MTVLLLNSSEHEKYYDEILSMLNESDNDFVPPLSARTSSTQSELNCSESNTDGVKLYFEELKKQRFAVAVEDGRLMAFVSYKENYTNSEIRPVTLPNIYISTLIVKPEGRGKGVTRMMYTALFDRYKNFQVFTRTWSSNIAHIKILEKFGFKVLCTLKDHRGEGIDTVYFVKA